MHSFTIFYFVFFSAIYVRQFELTHICDVCVTYPLLTSGVKCPVCSTLDGKYKKEDQTHVRGWLKKIGTPSYTDADNHNNWTTCNIYAPPCNASYKYRSYDGSCNNLVQTTWGMTNTSYIRTLPPNYKDGVHQISLAIDGHPRPLTRQLSTRIFPDGKIPDTVTLAVMQWSQVVAHDISSTPLTLESRDCCNPKQTPQEDATCLPTIIPPNDHFYSRFNVTCQNFRRNQYTHVGDECSSGPAQQFNIDSHALDGSVVYGSDLQTAISLRTFKNGKLRMQTHEDGRTFLPNLPADQIVNVCGVRDTTDPCYTAGDPRVNQNTQLSVLINVLFRTHNTMAEKLQNLHPDWDDETLYQETRNILVATIQHVTYNEWLAYYLGSKVMAKHGLYPKRQGYTEYKSGINLASINDFMTGVYRIGHSAIQGFLNMYNEKHHIVDSIPISNWTNRPFIIQESCNYDKFLRGLTTQPMEKIDRIATTQITNLLFHDVLPYGIDLISRDILRGRDHGIAPYVRYLEVCTGFKAHHFTDLKRVMPKQHVYLLKENYNSIQDIDLFVGGTLEKPVVGSRLGPTFLCFFTEQFYRKKWGDRFWYEVENQTHSFTEDQLKEIRKITLSKIICDGSDDITEMPLNSFLIASESNKIVKCNDIPGIDFKKF